MKSIGTTNKLGPSDNQSLFKLNASAFIRERVNGTGRERERDSE